MFTFSIFSVIFLSIGMVLYIMSDQIIELEKRYDEFCYDKLRKGDNDPCIIDFHNIVEPVSGPIYVYY
jgi:hypothetical protein